MNPIAAANRPVVVVPPNGNGSYSSTASPISAGGRRRLPQVPLLSTQHFKETRNNDSARTATVPKGKPTLVHWTPLVPTETPITAIKMPGEVDTAVVVDSAVIATPISACSNSSQMSLLDRYLALHFPHLVEGSLSSTSLTGPPTDATDSMQDSDMFAPWSPVLGSPPDTASEIFSPVLGDGPAEMMDGTTAFSSFRSTPSVEPPSPTGTDDTFIEDDFGAGNVEASPILPGLEEIRRKIAERKGYSTNMETSTPPTVAVPEDKDSSELQPVSVAPESDAGPSDDSHVRSCSLDPTASLTAVDPPSAPIQDSFPEVVQVAVSKGPSPFEPPSAPIHASFSDNLPIMISQVSSHFDPPSAPVRASFSDDLPVVINKGPSPFDPPPAPTLGSFPETQPERKVSAERSLFDPPLAPTLGTFPVDLSVGPAATGPTPIDTTATVTTRREVFGMEKATMSSFGSPKSTTGRFMNLHSPQLASEPMVVPAAVVRPSSPVRSKPTPITTDFKSSHHVFDGELEGDENTPVDSTPRNQIPSPISPVLKSYMSMNIAQGAQPVLTPASSTEVKSPTLPSRTVEEGVSMSSQDPSSRPIAKPAALKLFSKTDAVLDSERGRSFTFQKFAKRPTRSQSPKRSAKLVDPEFALAAGAASPSLASPAHEASSVHIGAGQKSSRSERFVILKPFFSAAGDKRSPVLATPGIASARSATFSLAEAERAPSSLANASPGLFNTPEANLHSFRPRSRAASLSTQSEVYNSPRPGSSSSANHLTRPSSSSSLSLVSKVIKSRPSSSHSHSSPAVRSLDTSVGGGAGAPSSSSAAASVMEKLLPFKRWSKGKLPLSPAREYDEESPLWA